MEPLIEMEDVMKVLIQAVMEVAMQDVMELEIVMHLMALTQPQNHCLHLHLQSRVIPHNQQHMSDNRPLL
ncbi:unnamed protein product [Cochlearia groenlandica]